MRRTSQSADACVSIDEVVQRRHWNVRPKNLPFGFWRTMFTFLKCLKTAAIQAKRNCICHCLQTKRKSIIFRCCNTRQRFCACITRYLQRVYITTIKSVRSKKAKTRICDIYSFRLTTLYLSCLTSRRRATKATSGIASMLFKCFGSICVPIRLFKDKPSVPYFYASVKSPCYSCLGC